MNIKLRIRALIIWLRIWWLRRKALGLIHRMDALWRYGDGDAGHTYDKLDKELQRVVMELKELDPTFPVTS